MEIETSLSAKLWIESYETQDTNLLPKHPEYALKEYTLTKPQVKDINLFLKKNRLTWETWIHTLWGLLLNKLSTVDTVCYGVTTADVDKQGTVIIQSPLKSIQSNINEKMSIEALAAQINQQLNDKDTNKNNLPDDTRYLLLTKTSNNNINSPIEINPHQFSLILFIDLAQTSNLSLLYNAFSFSSDRIQFIYDHFIFLLADCLANIKQQVTQLNLLTKSEQNEIFSVWGKPNYIFSVPPLIGCMHELFAAQARVLPEKIALNHHENNITYQQLDNAATTLALELIQKGVTSGDRISVLMERTPALLMVMLAVFKTGAVYVPINPKYPAERISYVLSDSQSKFLLIDDPQKIPDNNILPYLLINALTQEKTDLAPIEMTDTLPQVHDDTLAYIIYTSGTTGQPKGVMIRHKSLTNLITWYQGYFSISPDDRASQFASQGFDTFLCETVPFLALGASVHIVDDNIKLTPPLFFAWLLQQGITICDLPTAYAQMLFTLDWPKQLNLRLLKIGGESLARYPTQPFSFDMWNGYGPTEATIESTFYKIYTANTTPKKMLDYKPPPIGKPIVNAEVYVVDKYLQPVPVGIGGELLIGGLGVSTGYLNLPELTQQYFIDNPFTHNGKLYRTGDLVRWLPDGNLEFIGRLDHQVKIRGYRIELNDIETAIHHHSDVGEAIVLVKESVNHEKNLIAYVVPNLDKERYLYQERCLLSINQNKFVEAITEDISKEGVAISGMSEPLNPGQTIQLYLKLPGSAESKLLNGHIIWSQEHRCGIAFNLNEEEKDVLNKSIDYYLSTHNVMELLLSTAAKRNLRKALRKELPDYMIPTVFVTLLQFPLTFSGKIDVKALPPPHTFEQMLQKEFIPAKTNTEQQLAMIWAGLLNREKISLSDNFFDIGGNSILAAELSVIILREFNISVPTHILFDLPYIPILAEYIESNGEQYTKISALQEEIDQDAKLHENISPTQSVNPHLSDPQHILLTGAGGFLGVYLLHELLIYTKAKIYCLVRKGEFETAAQRLMANIHKFNLSDKISLTDRRIVVIPSDIALEHFAMPLELYNNLLDKIDLIYHCGAQVSIMAAYNKLRDSNVQGTIEIIKFATTKKDKPIHYISTLSAAYKKDEQGCLVEEFPDETYSDLFGGYAISKWVSERLLSQVKDRGLPASIYRSGYISGQTDTGMTNTNDSLLMLLKGCIQLGLAPDYHEKIAILPVNFVSQSIVRISLLQPADSHVYHIDHPIGILWRDLIAWVNEYGYNVKIIPTAEWKNSLLSITRENALFPFLPYYLSLPDNYQSPETNTTYTTSILNVLDMPYPEINAKLLTIYFDFLRSINFFPALQQPTLEGMKGTQKS
ncbi:MAG TPA: amino acid adenylation domain-containing protein [Gammaproteobacteria bacterium]|jgi:amino acid adenylation domain-containing protein/thioester reductase-like protein|nr:amino acid adenylation domain-containing protein [Gammaproteobacteria bacterium]